MGTSRLAEGGFSLLEMIVVLAGITLLTSIASTTFQGINNDQAIDDITSDLNYAASECLRAMRELPPPKQADSTDAYKKEVKKQLALNNDRNDINNSLNINAPFLIDAIDEKKLENMGYEFDNNHTTCIYAMIKPINTSSKGLPSLGFGILNNRVTKFGISKKEDKDARNACERWAKSLCVDNKQQSFSKFFNHMWSVNFSKEVCELDFKNSVRDSVGIAELKRWDPGDSTKGDQACRNSQPEGNNSSGYKQKCTISRCNKVAYALDQTFIGYSESDLDQAKTVACSTAIKEYIEGESYNGGSEIKEDLDSCDETIYICDGKAVEEDSYDICRINKMVEDCKLDLERIRTEESDGPHTVGNGAGPNGKNLEGLPPCGQEVWVYDKVIHYEKDDS